MRAAEIWRSERRQLQDLLKQQFGLQGSWKSLPGELDANYRLEDPSRGTYLVKVAHPDSELAHVELQIAVLDHLASYELRVAVPQALRGGSGGAHVPLETQEGPRALWVSTWLPGVVLAERAIASHDLCVDVGRCLGEVDRALGELDDEGAKRPQLKWNLCNADWIGGQIRGIADPSVAEAVRRVHSRYVDSVAARLETIPRGIVHNDANDHNLLVSIADPSRLVGLFDFGDLCETVRVAEAAIAATYLAMLSDDPLLAIDAVVRGYHTELPLSDEERELVVPLIETRLAVSLTNAAVEQQKRPEDPYVTVSQEGAARLLLQLDGRSQRVASVRLARACGESVGHSQDLGAWLASLAGELVPVLDVGQPVDEMPILDLSFETLLVGDSVLEVDAEVFSRRVDEAMRAREAECAIGRYREPRPIYTDAAFGGLLVNAPRRSVHLGIDLFAAAGTAVRAPLAGRVVDVRVCPGHLDYGGLVVLAHEGPGGEFCTLYGHLDPRSCEDLECDSLLEAGQAFARLGAREVNGGWPPHLHLQLLDHPAGELEGVPWEVADPDDLEAHLEVFPDPSPLVGLADQRAVWSAPADDLRSGRERFFAANLRTSYDEPVALVRGSRHVLFDRDGRRYLDAYNNVPHVGHCHPRVVEAVARQTALLATNTRYLHGGIQRYAERLCGLVPDSLSVVFFTPSGSEANELALRLARQHTSREDVCVMDHGYHGHTNAAVAMSPYKFRQPGAPSKPDWVHVTAQPDTYRGPHRGADAGARYSADVVAIIDALCERGQAPAAYLSECLPSVGGQHELPLGFLASVYEAVRGAGGVCIADDVQTALWRTGEHCFGFERQEVVPDILVLGKPLGNGFPLGAVMTSREIAESFARGPEFFSTFGGSTVAMAAGLAVLDVLDEEELRLNAKTVGRRLLGDLRALQEVHPLVGDVRGRGLFIGVELVLDGDSKSPATELAHRVKNRLRARRILIGTEGPHDNILKIRPPMTFDAAAAECLVVELDRVLRAVR